MCFVLNLEILKISLNFWSNPSLHTSWNTRQNYYFKWISLKHFILSWWIQIRRKLNRLKSANWIFEFIKTVKFWNFLNQIKVTFLFLNPLDSNHCHKPQTVQARTIINSFLSSFSHSCSAQLLLTVINPSNNVEFKFVELIIQVTSPLGHFFTHFQPILDAVNSRCFHLHFRFKRQRQLEVPSNHQLSLSVEIFFRLISAKCLHNPPISMNPVRSVKTLQNCCEVRKSFRIRITRISGENFETSDVN